MIKRRILNRQLEWLLGCEAVTELNSRSRSIRFDLNNFLFIHNRCESEKSLSGLPN